MARDGKSDLVDLELDIKIERDLAWLLTDGTVTDWVPKSQAENNGDGSFTMPGWLAKEKGFI